MKHFIPIFFVALLTGCSPVIDARLRLLDVSREGLARVSRSIDQRRQAAAALEAVDRKRLDAAFDADAKRQTAPTDAWIIEARTAYATAIDQFAARQRRAEQAAEADKSDVAAVDAALQQLQAIDRSQLKLDDFFGGLK